MDTFALTLHHDRIRQLQADGDHARQARRARRRRQPRRTRHVAQLFDVAR